MLSLCRQGLTLYSKSWFPKDMNIAIVPKRKEMLKKISGPPSESLISIVGSVVECSPATRAARVRFPDDANLFFFTYTQPPSAHHLPECKVHLLGVLGLKIKKKSFGDAGYRSPYLSHAKRALYHLSYVPFS